MATYPSAVYSPRTKENKPGVVYDADETTKIFAEDVVKDDAEIVAIETELGTNPKGTKADVKTRLNDVDSLLADHSARHENGGDDEISVAGLSGELADNQKTTGKGMIRTVNFVIDGGGSAITTGLKGFMRIPFAGNISKVTLLADQSGSIKIDIWEDVYSNFPPDNNDTITGANEPEISSATKDEDATLTDWTVAVVAGSILAFNVDSCTTITRVTVVLDITQTA